MIQSIRLVWTLFKLGKRIHNTFNEENPLSSQYKINVLKTALEAVDEGDILKLNDALIYFDRLSKSRGI